LRGSSIEHDGIFSFSNHFVLVLAVAGVLDEALKYLTVIGAARFP